MDCEPDCCSAHICGDLGRGPRCMSLPECGFPGRGGSAALYIRSSGGYSITAQFVHTGVAFGMQWTTDWEKRFGF